MLRFDVAPSARTLSRKASLVIDESSPYRNPPVYDATAADGRSIIFPQGLLFVGGGRFWLQDDTGRKVGPL